MTTDVSVEQRWIDIPSVNGMTVREATERLAEAGFKPVASPKRFLADSGDIVGGTLPPEGVALRRASRIDLLPAPKETVRKSADGAFTPEQLLGLGIMPDLTGMNVDDALAIVRTAGFHAWPRGGFSLTVEPDFVIFTEPRADTAVQTGTIVVWYALPVPPDEPRQGPPDPPVPLEG